MPPDLTDTFDGGDQGWSIYEGGALSPVDWTATGGNPGGFLSFTDPDSGSSDAAFGDAGYVAHISRYFGNARIVADMRSSAADAAPPTIRLVDPAYEDLGSIESTAGTPLTSSWQHYSFPLVAATGWYDQDGDRLDNGALRRFLNLDPVILVSADNSAQPGERTDLDNIGLSSEYPRGVSIKAKAGGKGFKGAITIKQGRDAPQCLAGQKIRILRKTKHSAKGFAKAKTDDAGRYSISKNVKPGRYFAQAPMLDLTDSADCGAATSKTIVVKP